MLRNIALVIIAILAGGLIGSLSGMESAVYPDSAVKVSLSKGGHGSGVYIGQNLILSAAHVVQSDNTVMIKTEYGDEMVGEVLWTNRKYDVALIRVEDPPLIHASYLSCTIPSLGDEITLRGNPQQAEFITVWGTIGGTVREFGPWASAVPTNAAIIPGQSGGPVFNEAGDIVGLAVGVMAVPMGMSASLVSLGVIVPGKTVCDLLGRA